MARVDARRARSRRRPNRKRRARRRPDRVHAAGRVDSGHIQRRGPRPAQVDRVGMTLAPRTPRHHSPGRARGASRGHIDACDLRYDCLNAPSARSSREPGELYVPGLAASCPRSVPPSSLPSLPSPLPRCRTQPDHSSIFWHVYAYTRVQTSCAVRMPPRQHTSTHCPFFQST